MIQDCPRDRKCVIMDKYGRNGTLRWVRRSCESKRRAKRREEYWKSKGAEFER